MSVGWRFEPDVRAALLARFAPLYAETVADHITLVGGAAARDEAPERADAVVVGVADDGRGVQALVVAVDGETARPGGGTYHITWSLGAGREARESNDVIAARGWEPVADGPRFALLPARW